MKKSTGKSRTALFWHLAKKELLARRLSSGLSLAAIAFAATLALTITLYLTGTQIQQEKILGNMQHVMYMDILPEQLQAIGADERVEMCVPYKPLDTEFEMDGVKFSLVYYESVPAGIQTYTVSGGRPPEAYNEIVVDKSFMDALGQESVLGEELTLDLNGRKETFLISGYTDDAYSMLTHPMRVSQSFADQSPEMSSVPYTALVRLRDASEMPSATFSTTVYQIALDYGVARANVNINGTFETSLQSGNTALYVIVLLAIMIAVACGIVIYSIFYLSVSSSTQRLGQYLTIGMTKKQMRGMIRREGFLLTLLALPVSLVVSAGITADNYTEYGAAVEEEIRSIVEQYDDLSLWTLREQSLEDSSAIRQRKCNSKPNKRNFDFCCAFHWKFTLYHFWPKASNVCRSILLPANGLFGMLY